MMAEAMDSILWMTDTYFVSRLGDRAVAAVGLGGYLGWMAFTVSSIVGMGSLVVVAQAIGAGARDKAERGVRESVVLSVIIGLPVFLLFWRTSLLLLDMIAGPRVTRDVVQMADGYFKMRLLGIIPAYIGVSLSSAFRGAGVTKPVMWASLAYTVTNLMLDPLLIFGLLGLPRMGVEGAGLASAIANGVFAIVQWAIMNRTIGIRPGVAVPTRLSTTIVKLGVPTFVERIVMVSGHLAYLGVIARCGNDSLTAHTIGVRVESLAFLPLFSIGEASAALAGQAIGAGDRERARRAALEAGKLNFTAGLLVGAILVLLSGRLPAVFSENPRVVYLSKIYLILAAISEPLFGLSISQTMAIRGAGNTLAPLIANMAAYYTLRVVPAPILASLMPPAYCAVGAWLSMVLDVAGRSILASILVERFFHRLARRVV